MVAQCEAIFDLLNWSWKMCMWWVLGVPRLLSVYCSDFFFFYCSWVLWAAVDTPHLKRAPREQVGHKCRQTNFSPWSQWDLANGLNQVCLMKYKAKFKLFMAMQDWNMTLLPLIYDLLIYYCYKIQLVDAQVGSHLDDHSVIQLIPHTWPLSSHHQPCQHS